MTKADNKKKTISLRDALPKKRKFERLPMFDIPFLIAVLMLLVFGLAMLFSAGFAQSFYKMGNSYSYIIRQLRSAAIGVVGMIVVSYIPQKFYKKLIVIFYLICVALLIAVLVIPTRDTERRWLYVAGVQFQPSEFAKIAVILFMSQYIAAFKDKMNKFSYGIVGPVIIFMLCCGLVAVETHLSGAILIFLVGITIMCIGGSRLLYMLPFAVVGVAGAAFLVFNNAYMMKRVQTWLNPEADPLGDGFQPLQSLLTIGSGGLFGLGYGKSRQKYLYLPEPHNDFIFSVVAEELGLVGVIVVIMLFGLLIWRGIYIARRAKDTFSSLLVAGITANVAYQMILNIAVVSNSIPPTGISLPFFSYGGTSLIVLLCEMGLILNVSRFANINRGIKTPVAEFDFEDASDTENEEAPIPEKEPEEAE